MEVDGGIVVGLPLNFIVIIAGPSFFGDWESEFWGVGGGRTTLGSFASSVWELLTEGIRFAGWRPSTVFA